MKLCMTTLILLAALATAWGQTEYRRAAATDYWYPVSLVDETDGYTPETEKKFGDTTITYVNLSDANEPNSYTDSAADWMELGDGTGDYKVRIGATEFTADNNDYRVKIAVSGCRLAYFTVRTEIAWDVSAAGLAAVNAQVDTALEDYNSPTKSELDAGFAALNDPNEAAIAAEVVTELLAETFDGVIKVGDLFDIQLAALTGKCTITDNGDADTYTFYKHNGTTISYSLTSADDDGARAAGAIINEQ